MNLKLDRVKFMHITQEQLRQGYVVLVSQERKYIAHHIVPDTRIGGEPIYVVYDPESIEGIDPKLLPRIDI